jgi:hypothetical protein
MGARDLDVKRIIGASLIPRDSAFFFMTNGVVGILQVRGILRRTIPMKYSRI